MMAEQKRKKRRVSNCRQKIQDKECPGKYVLTYESNAPIFTCDSCGHQDLTWKKFYDEYLQLYKDKNNWEEPKNNVSCLIGMFCYLYKEFYKTDYTFVPKNPNPYSSKECRDAWTLIASFGGNVHESRKYIYWLFKRGINKTTTITNFGYLLAPGLIRKYKLYSIKKNVLTRASKLPEEYISWCKETIPEIFTKYAMETMNDLGALLGYVKHYSDTIGEDSAERKALSKSEQYGLIKEGKLNIGEVNEKSNR
jgi:hypothetical protein